jgi:CRP/FNR family transcriptional regulator, nitrogen fixation regulation protein
VADDAIADHWNPMSKKVAIVAHRRSALVPVAIAPKSWANAMARDQTDAYGVVPIKGVVSHLAQDREIYAEGEEASVFFKVVTGVVRTCSYLRDGRRQIDAFYVASEVFGLEAGIQYRLSAEAASDCTLISYRRRTLERLAANNDAVSRQLISFAMRSMARSQDHSLLLGRGTAVERLAAFLIEWAQHSPGAQTVALPLTRRDIADYLGLTLETVSRMFSQLSRNAVIELTTARQIRFKDVAALRELNCLT